jgi:hydroxymethylbilane synthase
MDLLQTAEPDRKFTLQAIRTEGDIKRSASLMEIGGRGVFVKELESALQEKAVDIAVHSAKDLPSSLPDGLTLAAVPQRGPVEDVLVSIYHLTLPELPPRLTVATGSPRRKALVRMFRPDLKVVEIRGNVDTRLRKLKECLFDAIILARAGLARLGLERHICQILPPDEFVPAPGQGALVLEVREEDTEVMRVVAKINSARDFACLKAERSLLQRLNAGCSVPVGAWARWSEDGLILNAVVLEPEGRRAIRSSGMTTELQDALELGEKVAEDLLVQGAGELISNA